MMPSAAGPKRRSPSVTMAVMTWRAAASIPRVTCTTTLRCHLRSACGSTGAGKNRLLRLCYPVALSAPTFRYEVPYGSMERLAGGREWHGQRWVLVSGTDGDSLALANDAKDSYAADWK